MTKIDVKKKITLTNCSSCPWSHYRRVPHHGKALERFMCMKKYKWLNRRRVALHIPKWCPLDDDDEYNPDEEPCDRETGCGGITCEHCDKTREEH